MPSDWMHWLNALAMAFGGGRTIYGWLTAPGESAVPLRRLFFAEAKHTAMLYYGATGS